MKYKNGVLIGSEIVFDSCIELTDNLTLSEADVDSKSIGILKKLGYLPEIEIRQQKTSIPEIDKNVKSKISLENIGNADVYVLIDDKLKIIIENKKTSVNVEEGIADAIHYANCLLEKKYDIRIAIGYNGKKCILRVYDCSNEKWVPFLINGVELNEFPSKELINIIYTYKGITGIVILENEDNINLKNTIKTLKNIYRTVSFIQNDNQRSIDFTISFIGLKSILEKHSNDLDKNWNDFDVPKQKKLKEKIKIAVEDIINNLENGYEEIFIIKEDIRGHGAVFDFLKIIEQFPDTVNEGESAQLKEIFSQINELPHLHSVKFDLFGEIYQSLMEKDTRKKFGQFFTPRHLIRPLVRLFYENELEKIIGDVENNVSVNPKKICDPACGTGGFLTASFKYFEDNIRENIDVEELAKKSIHGFDLYPANTVRSRINMYLAGDGFSEIKSLNSLIDLENNPYYDYIITNVPFGSGDFLVDQNIINNKRKEVNFLIKIIKILKSSGKGLIIVPDGILETPTLYPLRKWIIKNCIIEKIIGLPKHVFAPYTKEKTYALFIEKRPKTVKLEETITERIWMYIVDNDGYANSDKRFRTGRKDKYGRFLHDELSLWKDNEGKAHVSILEENWRKKIQSDEEKYFDIQGNQKKGKKYGYVEMHHVNEENYYNLLCEFHLRPFEVKYINEDEFENKLNEVITKLKELL